MHTFFKWNFITRIPHYLIPFYFAMVQPHFIYGVPACPSGIPKQKKELEVTTRCATGIHHLSHPERFERVKRFSFWRRRLHLSFVGSPGHYAGWLSQVRLNPWVRRYEDQPFVFAKPRVNTSFCKKFFAVWVVNHWIKLPNVVVFVLLSLPYLYCGIYRTRR